MPKAVMNMIEKFGENTVFSEIARSNRYGNNCFELLVSDASLSAAAFQKFRVVQSIASTRCTAGLRRDHRSRRDHAAASGAASVYRPLCRPMH